ncbi:MAG: ARMT1-like domain-containing protein [Desulfovermiculus sp.]|nr:ARMT1-like domain-containing protein [Desulfovermiculus sp.]
MQTFSECIPCFERQIKKLAAMVSSQDLDLQKRVQTQCLDHLNTADTNYPPPELAARIYAKAAEISGQNDFFAQHKQAANTQVLGLLPRLEERIQASSDSLLTALRFSLIANYIDVGVDGEFDWETALDQEKAQEEMGGYPMFRQRLDTGKSQVMILGDNAGEIGMDTLLVKQLQNLGAEVTYVVRGAPILNDATLDDAHFVGMDRLCRVISSGVDSPGTILSRCHPDFLQELYAAPIVISKGQGNFESLHGRLPGIFFALKVKCPVVARLTGFPVRTTVFDLLAKNISEH